MRRSVLGLLACAALGAATLGTTPAGADERPGHSGGHQSSPATYRVTVENLTSGQWFTPPNFALHDQNVDVFSPGRKASPGVLAVAENGDVPTLASELRGAVDDRGKGVSGVGAANPISPGSTVSFDVTGTEERLSIVTMIICTNDGFTGLDGRNVPSKIGKTRTYSLRGYDAGTEVNTELRADIVPAPFCGTGGGSGVSNPALAEGGRIRHHQGITGVGDLPASFDWDDPVAQVTVTRIA